MTKCSIVIPAIMAGKKAKELMALVESRNTKTIGDFIQDLPHDQCKLILKHMVFSLRNSKKINPNKFPHTTSDGETMQNCTCGGRCCVFYDEDRQYRVWCENCGTVVIFESSSMDKAIEAWNRVISRCL